MDTSDAVEIEITVVAASIIVVIPDVDSSEFVGTEAGWDSVRVEDGSRVLSVEVRNAESWLEKTTSLDDNASEDEMSVGVLDSTDVIVESGRPSLDPLLISELIVSMSLELDNVAVSLEVGIGMTTVACPSVPEGATVYGVR